ncbi:hypothetical protein QBE53_10785 [Vallitaleaceae bacterium 9-2]
MSENNNVKELFTQEDIQKNKGMAILAYIIFFVPLLVDGAKDSPFVKFHVNQGLLLVLGYLALSVIGMVPILGWIISVLGWLVLVVIHLITLIGAANGQAKKLPLVGDIKLIK